MTWTPLLPPMLVIPPGAALMALVVWHTARTHGSDHPASRRRIRLANNLLILATIPLLMAGLCVLDPRGSPREWALVWLAAMALLSINVGLAMADAMNTARLLAASRRRLREHLLQAQAHAQQLARAAAHSMSRPPGHATARDDDGPR